KQAVLVQCTRQMEDEATWSHKQTVSRTRGLHEKSYPCHEQANSFPVARNVHERNGERGSGPVMRGEKRGEIRPVGTISREVMRMRLGGRYSQKRLRDTLLQRSIPFASCEAALELASWVIRAGDG